ncbi:sensor histidine kinase [Clostridium sp. TW13]|uniref:Sensor histidine kinase n=2 Tax=Inconstantimicrobium mannanitabidum TaxID=1604901 RepID=A0ACB5RDF2_9CLOT|nr:sensor histidine kinase [Clostridium sp. TW13]
MTIYFIIECFQRKRFYDEIFGVLDNLDKKYLIAEVIKKPSFFEGRIIYDILQQSNREMHEHVNSYKILQNEYREYIEAWVHEIKTPIASSKITLENSDSLVKNKLQNDLRKVEGFINQALYYSRSTDVSNDYLVKEFEVVNVIRNVIRNNRRDFIEQKISVDIEGIAGNIVTDMKWTEFIVNQIVINSIKYSRKQDASIKFYTKEGENNLVLFIEDNGIGICTRDIGRVFDKGFTGENGRVYGKSTGIGLYLCKKLCSKLGFGIDIDSTEGEGTCVKIIFPVSNLTRIKN